MCGITILINQNNTSVEASLIHKMNALINHRGPDGEGTHLYKQVGLGHKRLAIIDLSDDGAQPLHYKNTSITYNGEIYNYIELKKELEDKGHIFQTKTDTEVVLAAYNEWGQNCVKKMNGMWAFAILDKDNNQMFFSRDRFGIKPLYYTQIGNEFCVGSEIKQFSAHSEWRATLNHERAYDYLVNSMMDHTNETLYKGVSQLLGGHHLIYNLATHSFEIKQWHDINTNTKTYKGDFDSAKEKNKNLIKESCQLRLRSDVKVGACLSGGLDSSTLVCNINELLKENPNPAQLETISSCSHFKQYDEQEYIDEIDKETRIKAHKIFPDPKKLFNDLDDIIWHQDEPFGSTSIFAQWSVFEEAKKNDCIVMIDGQGADEQLCGYHTFFSCYFSSLLKRGRLITLIKELMVSFVNNKGSLKANCYQFASYVLPENLRNKLRYSFKRKKTKWLNIEFQQHRDSFNKTSLKDLSIDQILKSSLPILLHYEDRNSMAFSIESRVPFLDYRLVEFVLSLPDKFKIKNGVSKYILRESQKEGLPNKIYNRKTKLGFVTPESIWLKQNSTIVRQYLDQTCDTLGDLVKKKEVLQSYDDLLANNHSISNELWRLICLGKWARIFSVSIEDNV